MFLCSFSWDGGYIVVTVSCPILLLSGLAYSTLRLLHCHHILSVLFTIMSSRSLQQGLRITAFIFRLLLILNKYFPNPIISFKLV